MNDISKHSIIQRLLPVIQLLFLLVIGFGAVSENLCADTPIVYIPITYVSPYADSVAIPIRVENIEGAVSGQFLILFSDEIISNVISVKKGNVLNNSNVFLNYLGRPDSLRISFITNPPLINGTGDLVIMKFRLQDGLQAGDQTELHFANYAIQTIDGDSFVIGYSGQLIVQFQFGDVNTDLFINIHDLTRLIEIVGNINGPYSDAELLNSDLDLDGQINQQDILLLVSYILGL